MTSRTISLLATAVVCALAACTAHTAGSSSSGGDDPLEGWGIGSKADEGGCDNSGDLCWTTADADAMRRIAMLENDVLLSVGDGATALQMIVAEAGELSHKLDGGERAELARLEAETAALPGNLSREQAVAVLGDVHRSVLSRVRATHYAAHMVPVGRDADRELHGGAADDPRPAETHPDPEHPHYTAGMIESLHTLRDNGFLGKAYAWMLESTGVLDRDYRVVNATNFASYDPAHGHIVPLGISREEQAERIVQHYNWAAAQVGLVAGVEGLIPIAGVPISIAHETYKLFQLHAQMAFEVAAVYGWDIREGRNLFTVSMMVMTVGTLAEVTDVLASNAGMILLAKALATHFGVRLPLRDLEKQLAQRSIALLFRIFGREAQEQLAHTAVEQGVKGVGRQVLGWATLGLAVLASAAIDYVATEIVGEHVSTVARSWFSDMMMDGATYLSRPRPRECMFQALAAMAHADGAVTSNEVRLYQAFLAKPYHVNESTWFQLASEERVRHARTLREMAGRSDAGDAAVACLTRELGATLPKHRMALLGHLYGMANVDAREHEAETALYGRMRMELDGDGWFDGAEIDPQQMDYVERSIYVLVYPSTIEVPDEHREAIASILPEHVFTFLTEMPPPDVARDFRCGYEGVCN